MATTGGDQIFIAGVIGGSNTDAAAYYNLDAFVAKFAVPEPCGQPR